MKISQYNEAINLTGEEVSILAIGGQNFKYKLSTLVSKLVTKVSLGLDKVDNTADVDKPVSTAVAQALSEKAPSEHSHQLNQINGLEDALGSKAPSTHSHEMSQVNGLSQALTSKSDKGHTHAITDVSGLTDALAGKAESNHRHSMSSIDGLTDTLALQQQAINQKAPATHTHTADNIEGLAQFIANVVGDIGAGDVEVGELQW